MVFEFPSLRGIVDLGAPVPAKRSKCLNVLLAGPHWVASGDLFRALSFGIVWPGCVRSLSFGAVTTSLRRYVS